MSRALNDTPPPPVQPVGSVHRLATLALGWPSTLLLSLWCALLLGKWAPKYLTWPWFVDQDHFAMIAQSWSRGKRLYRDLFTNQLPGEIYLFRALGEAFGWGNTVAFYAVDVATLVLFGILIILWSRRRFGRALPGLIGLGIFLTYYTSQSFAIAGQRDWHAVFFAIGGLLALDLLPGRPGRIASGLAIGVAMSIRPQFLLVVPGMFLALASAPRDPDEGGKKVILAWVEWCVAVGLMLLVAFLPLIAGGLLPDFIRDVRTTDYGAGFKPSIGLRIGRISTNLIAKLKVGFVFLSLLGLAIRTRKPGWIGLASLVALQGSAIAFGVLSPIDHLYYQIPVIAYYSVAAVLLTGLVLDGRSSDLAKASFLVLMLAITAGDKPLETLRRLANPDRNGPPAVAGGGPKVTPEPGPGATAAPGKTYGLGLAVSYLIHRQMPELPPPGWYDPYGRYAWEDYRATIEYLRGSTEPDTPVANLTLQCVTAITSVIPRNSPLPCDGVGLSFFPSLIQGGLDTLENTEGCVVVWDPGLAEGQYPKLAPLFEVVRKEYRPEARFGHFEVWRRDGGPPK